MTRERVKDINEKLERLKYGCLELHSDSITYQICELLQEIVDDLPIKE